MVSAPDPAGTSRPPLLVVIDPLARLADGESVRIARDVLCAGAPGTKVCLPQSVEETERALARRGSRRPVVVGDDRALLRAVQLLHRERELSEAALSVVPVGTAAAVALTRGLGVPADAVSAARTVLDGVGCRLDLLLDDSGGVVLGGLRIPEVPGVGAVTERTDRLEPAGCAPFSRTRRSLT
ncbi:MAG: diacylglycerol kinase, partial [Streptomyces sp.]